MSRARPVQVSGVARRFGTRVAVDGVDLTVAPGEIVGLAGPNGSGKTTLLRMLAGLLRPDAGRVAVFGHDPADARAKVMERARFVFAPPALFDQLTAWEHVVHLASIRPADMPGLTLDAAERALETVGLLPRANDRVAAFSFGMRQRLALALALVPLPELLVLDEPSDGLDPVAVLELRAILEKLRRDDGVAILLSSHLMLELDVLVDRLLVLEQGRTLYHGEPEALTADTERLVLETDDPARAAIALSRGGWDPRADDEGRVELPVGALRLDEAQSLLAGAGVELRAFGTRRMTLEQALIERLRGDGGAA